MFLHQINPFIRFVNFFIATDKSKFKEQVALDTRLFFTLNGYGKINVNSTEYEMKENSLIIINSGIPYHVLAPKESISYIQLNFDYTQNSRHISRPVVPTIKNNFDESMLLDLNLFEDYQALSNVLYIFNIPSIKNKILAIVEEYKHKILFYREKSGHILAECIIDCLNNLEHGSSYIKNTKYHDILSYIHSHYNENLTNKFLGKNFGYHPNYISYLIKQLTGFPIHKYLLHIRLENAANLLMNSNLSINEIAHDTGFNDAAYFTDYFKRYFGIAPSKYRNI